MEKCFPCRTRGERADQIYMQSTIYCCSSTHKVLKSHFSRVSHCQKSVQANKIFRFHWVLALAISVDRIKLSLNTILYLRFLKARHLIYFLASPANIPTLSKTCLTCQVYSFSALHSRSYCGLGSASLKEKEL